MVHFRKALLAPCLFTFWFLSSGSHGCILWLRYPTLELRNTFTTQMNFFFFFICLKLLLLLLFFPLNCYLNWCPRARMLVWSTCSIHIAPMPALLHKYLSILKGAILPCTICFCILCTSPTLYLLYLWLNIFFWNYILHYGCCGNRKWSSLIMHWLCLYQWNTARFMVVDKIQLKEASFRETRRSSRSCISWSFLWEFLLSPSHWKKKLQYCIS